MSNKVTLSDLTSAMEKVADKLGVSVHTAFLMLPVPASTDSVLYEKASDKIMELYGIDELTPFIFTPDEELVGLDAWAALEGKKVKELFGFTDLEHRALINMEKYFFSMEADSPLDEN